MAVVCEVHGQVKVEWVEKSSLPCFELYEAMRGGAIEIHSYAIAETEMVARNI